MSEPIQVSVFEAVGSGICVASEDGQRVHDRIARAVTAGQSILLSFRGVELLTSAFLNAAIGQLYDQFTEEQVRSHLRVEELGQQDLKLLKRVIDRAKDYHSDPERYARAVREELGADDE